MQLSDRIVVKIPMDELWSEMNGEFFIKKRYLNEAVLREILETNEIRFVVADVGQKLLWIENKDRFLFWKQEVKEHILENDSHIDLRKYSNEYAYMASEWINNKGELIVLLDKFH